MCRQTSAPGPAAGKAVEAPSPRRTFPSWHGTSSENTHLELTHGGTAPGGCTDCGFPATLLTDHPQDTGTSPGHRRLTHQHKLKAGGSYREAHSARARDVHTASQTCTAVQTQGQRGESRAPPTSGPGPTSGHCKPQAKVGGLDFLGQICSHEFYASKWLNRNQKSRNSSQHRNDVKFKCHI